MRALLLLVMTLWWMSALTTARSPQLQPGEPEVESESDRHIPILFDVHDEETARELGLSNPDADPHRKPIENLHPDNVEEKKRKASPRKTLHHIIALEKHLSAFGDAVRRFPEIVELLEGASQGNDDRDSVISGGEETANTTCDGSPVVMTVFAPSNHAFEMYKKKRRAWCNGDADQRKHPSERLHMQNPTDIDVEQQQPHRCEHLPPLADDENLLKMLRAHLLEGKSWLSKNLLEHIKDGSRTQAEGTNEFQLIMKDGRRVPVRTCKGMDDGDGVASEICVGDAQVDASLRDLEACNGVLHVVDWFLPWWENPDESTGTSTGN
ncbi:hypothetical protein HK102_001567 [Quaeritorhiza haematococci]|nr:hypothetical protein HK102_001567 [Quaeritorhiza haematococci]